MGGGLMSGETGVGMALPQATASTRTRAAAKTGKPKSGRLQSLFNRLDPQKQTMAPEQLRGLFDCGA